MYSIGGGRETPNFSVLQPNERSWLAGRGRFFPRDKWRSYKIPQLRLIRLEGYTLFLGHNFRWGKGGNIMLEGCWPYQEKKLRSNSAVYVRCLHCIGISCAGRSERGLKFRPTRSFPSSSSDANKTISPDISGPQGEMPITTLWRGGRV